MIDIVVNGVIWAKYDPLLRLVFFKPQTFGVPSYVINEVYKQISELITD